MRFDVGRVGGTVQSVTAVVSESGLFVGDPRAARRGAAGDVPLRPHVLLRLRQQLARAGALRPPAQVDQKVRRRLGDLQLDRRQHQGSWLSLPALRPTSSFQPSSV